MKQLKEFIEAKIINLLEQIECSNEFGKLNYCDSCRDLTNVKRNSLREQKDFLNSLLIKIQHDGIEGRIEKVLNKTLKK